MARSVTDVLTRFLSSENAEVRQTAIRAYAQHKNIWDKLLLSRDLDADNPWPAWLDPQEPVTEARVADASSRLGMTPEQVRSRYEAMAVDLNLKLSWKN